MSDTDDFYVVAFDQDMGLFCPKCSACVATVSSATLAEFGAAARAHTCQEPLDAP